MINVLLVDDQPAVIGFLRNSLDWESLNMRISGHAANGEEALRLLEETAPDIVVTDIKMPVMDGMELMRSIRERRHPCKIVVLSAYGEFEYAKQSIQYGVSHYLLKPVEKAKLLDILNQISTEIAHEQEFNQEFVLMKRKIQAYILEEHQRKLIKLLQSRQNDRIAQMVTDPLLQQVASGTFACMMLESPDPIDAESYAPFVRAPQAYALALPSDGAEAVCFYSAASEAEETAIGRELTAHYGFPAGTTIGISNRHSGTEAIVAAYTEAKEALKGGFYSGRTVNRFNELIFQAAKRDKRAVQTKEKIVELLRSGRVDSCVAFIREEWLESFREQNLSPVAVYQSCYELLFMLKSELGADAEQSSQLTEDLQRLSAMASLDRVVAYVADQIVALAERLQSEQAQTDHLVRQVKAYIEAHYRTDIALETMAEKLFVSKYYLSRTFSKVTGETIWEYLIGYRLEKAKQLLRSSSLKTYVIAAEVGYENTSHFSTLFKKHVGVSPLEYKQTNATAQY